MLPAKVHAACVSRPDAPALVYAAPYDHAASAGSLHADVPARPAVCRRGSRFLLSSWSRRAVWCLAVRWARVLEAAAANKMLNAAGVFPTVGIAVGDASPWLPILHLACLLARAPFVSGASALAIVPLDLDDPRLPLVLDDAKPIVIVINTSDDIDFLAPLVRCHKAEFVCLQQLLQLEIVGGPDIPTLDWSLYRPSDVSHVFFTSGSTGRPKGCVVTLESLTSYCLDAKPSAHSISANATSVVFIASAHTFDPSIGDHLSAFAIPGSVIARAPRQILTTSLASLLEVLDVTHICTNPSLFETVCTELSIPLPRSLKVVALGGEVMGSRVVQKCLQSPNLTLINTYGVTECTVYQLCMRVESVEGRKWFTSHSVMEGNSLYVMRPNSSENTLSWTENISNCSPIEMERITEAIVSKWINDNHPGELI
ncbi:hypothetical protein HDU84_004373, partial [Entophlyctis sp. JEL0112]